MHIWLAKQWIFSGAVDKIIKLHTFLFRKNWEDGKGDENSCKKSFIPYTFFRRIQCHIWLCMTCLIVKPPQEANSLSPSLSMSVRVHVCVQAYFFVLWRGLLTAIDRPTCFFYSYISFMHKTWAFFFFAQRKNYNHSKPLRLLGVVSYKKNEN